MVFGELTVNIKALIQDCSVMKKVIYLILVALLSVGVSSCGGDPTKKKYVDTPTSGLTTIICDNSFENIMQQEIDVFEYQYPEAYIIPYYTNEKVAIDSLLSLNSKTIVIPRDLTEKEVSYLKSKRKRPRSMKIAIDAIALIVNPENTVNALALQEIAEILSGETTEWNQVEPSKLGKIEVVFDHEGSSVVQYMRDSLLHGQNFGPNVFAQDSIEGVFEAVRTHKNAIGIIGVSWISSDMRSQSVSAEQWARDMDKEEVVNLDFDKQVKVLAVRRNDCIDAYKPYQAYIFDGSYPLHRPIYMITTGVPGSLASGFYSFVTSPNGQKIILKTGVLPAVVHPRIVTLTK